jgi:hypothetical protein
MTSSTTPRPLYKEREVPMGLIEVVLYIVLVVLVLQLIFSFFNLDRRIVGIIVVLVLLAVFFGPGGRRFGLRVQADTPNAPPAELEARVHAST